ncbi:MAG TPA: DUF5985 family protein [Bryobacteraceae bacterium]
MTPLSPIEHPTLDIFLLGFVVAASLAAALFFLRFWKNTRDLLFLAFTVFFLVQAVTQSLVLGYAHPNEGSIGLFLLRLLSVLVILAAILWKNFGKG